MQKIFDKYRFRSGFSLAEALASLVIGTMVLVAMLRVYRQVDRAAASVRRKVDSPRLASEVLQRIAEDLDGIIASDPDTKVTVENKFIKGFPASRLTIEKTIKDERNRTLIFNKIVWQSAYDYFSDANGLTLFRSQSGMSLEDKLLDEKRADIEKEYPLVPICSGVTYLKIQVPRGEELLERWISSRLPPGVIVTISFAEPFETLERTLDVPEEEKTTRTIAVDRARKMKFSVVRTEPEEEIEGEEEEELEETDMEEGDVLPEDEAMSPDDETKQPEKGPDIRKPTDEGLPAGKR